MLAGPAWCSLYVIRLSYYLKLVASLGFSQCLEQQQWGAKINLKNKSLVLFQAKALQQRLYNICVRVCVCVCVRVTVGM